MDDEKAQGRPERRRPRSLSDEECQTMLDVLHANCFVDKAPASTLPDAVELSVSATVAFFGLHCSSREVHSLLAQLAGHFRQMLSQHLVGKGQGPRLSLKNG
jgi:hypothetical protein